MLTVRLSRGGRRNDPVYTIVIENDVVAKEYLDLYNILWEHSQKVV